MGRRKIEMKVVKDTSCRQVTFSKRRTGLFKKANELATLCGAEVAVVVFSPGGKPFSFGQPNVESVADRFLKQESKPNRDKAAIAAAVPSKNKKNNAAAAAAAAATAEKLNQQLNEQVKQLQDEKKRGEALDKEIAAGEKAAPIDIGDLGFEDLKKLKRSLEELREKGKERVGEIEASSTLLMLSKDFRG
ncbi:Agamous-like MADS-box protein AGL61 [Morus notabilis]|uniref:Agamous-like MADS-box protein AGL61 n=1 Tax=Morus notabilis TaxID=981085 RepID=W9S6V3_9ROSA|nr:agamous-like MADS-box protein AGL29 [Morus notabilis]EXC29397.1 Agamous-like MADS-box protein AGL61 [Morus notabilis]